MSLYFVDSLRNECISCQNRHVDDVIQNFVIVFRWKEIKLVDRENQCCLFKATSISCKLTFSEMRVKHS